MNTASERITQIQRMFSEFQHTNSANKHVAGHENWLRIELLNVLQDPNVAMSTTKDGDILLTLAKDLDAQKLFTQ